MDYSPPFDFRTSTSQVTNCAPIIEEENWDDDFEFGSSAGSPVLGSQPRTGTVTPPNFSPLDRRRSASSGADAKKLERNRWSNGSFEDWDDQDETINVQGFMALQQQQQQQPSTPRQRSPKPNYRTPVRGPRSSTGSKPFWDDDDDVDIARSAGVMPSLPSATFGPPISTANLIFSPSQPPSAQPSDSNISPSKSGAPFPSVFQDANSSTTDTSTTGNPESSEHPSDTSASVSQSSSFFGRLGRRLSKAKPPSVALSPATTEGNLSSSIFSPPTSTTFSPPALSGNLAPAENGGKFVPGHSPSKSRVFTFGSSILKRSGSLSRSSNQPQPTDPSSMPPLPTKKTPNTTPGSECSAEGGPRLGLGVHVLGANGAGEAHTAPAEINAERYTIRANPASSSHLQYSSHIHSQSLAGLGLAGAGKMGYGLGGPPSPTGRKGKQDINSLGGIKLSEKDKQRVASGSKTDEEKKSSGHQPSLSTSGAFFASIRRRPNPLQPTNKVPNSAKTIPSPNPAMPKSGSTPVSSTFPSIDITTPTQAMTPQEQISSMTQAQIQAQAQAQRQRRTHRRNVSAGAMITSVIDEVSSDGTISNKLTAIRDRAAQKSGLRESTTASEIRRNGLDGDASGPDSNSKNENRLSAVSDKSATSLSRVVSPIEFTRSSEESNTSSSFKAPAFVFPRSMNLRSPLLSSEDRSLDQTEEEPLKADPVSNLTSSGLLPAVELSRPSHSEDQDAKSSTPTSSIDPKNRRLQQISSSSSLAEPDDDADATPLAVPRKRHHIQMSNGTVVPASSLDPPGQSKNEELNADLAASVSAPMSMASMNSNKTLTTRNPTMNKHHEAVNGRTSPGISASLGRLAGSSTAEKIEGGAKAGGSGIARRNSLTGGTTSATLSTSGSLGGGLKIPARISQKQDALKRDLNAVREFANSINELKRLQASYQAALKVVSDLSKPILPSVQVSPSRRLYRMRATSPTPHFHIPRPPSLVDPESQPSSPTSPTFDKTFFQNPPRRAIVHQSSVPDLAEDPEEEDDQIAQIPKEQRDRATASLAELDNHYGIWWECADLLVELGSAAPPAVAATPVKSPTMASLQRATMTQEHSTPRPKERHATLPRHEQPPLSVRDLASPSTSHEPSSDPATSSGQRRGSTGQQDLNPRQIQLLKGMLTTPNPNDLSSSVDFQSSYVAPTSTLSPVISYPSSSVRSAVNFETPRVLPSQPVPYLTDDEDVLNEKEEKRNRRISLAGRLGVKEILATLKRTKEKVMRQRARQQYVAPEDASRASLDYGTASRASIDQSRSVSQAPPSPRPGLSRENLNISSPPQTGAPPSPYKRNRRRSLASIFKFGSSSSTAQNEDKLLTYSRSRIDLASPTPGEDPNTRHGGGLRVDDGPNTDIDSDWDYMNSPSDIPGHYRTLQRKVSSSQDLSHSGYQSRGRTAPVGVPIGSSRAGSTVSRNTSTSRHVYTSASASAASLASTSIYGSAASHQSLHEAFGGRGMSDKSEDERRRLKKPVRPPRRPPSASRRSIHTSSQTSLPGQVIGLTPPGIVSPIMDRAYPSTASTSHQSQTASLSNHSTSTHSISHRRRTPSMTDMSSPRLALTPENIVPLLVYAREVKLKLQECITEVKLLETDLLLARAAVEDKEDMDGSVELQGRRRMS